MANKKPRYKDETGKAYGWLKVVRYTRTDFYKGAMFECQCKCGKILEVPGTRLRAGQRTSCGCKRAAPKKPNKSPYCIICGSELVHARNMCYRCYRKVWEQEYAERQERYL